MPNYTNDVGYDFAIHSDFLIHWTGKDIESEVGWDNGIYSKTEDQEIINKYIIRLKHILQYGFWMTEDPESYPELENVPKVPQTCFTELKLSQARKHARKFGRLGIGVKRLFLFHRGGRPVVYYANGLPVSDPLLDACKEHLANKEYLNFFKPMNSNKDRLNYDLYGESEWRILFNQEFLNKRFAKNPQDIESYYKSLDEGQKTKLKYLLPIYDWLGIIIYPSLEVKQTAFADQEIRDLIQVIVNNKTVETGIWPIEVDLDACRNF